LIVLEDMHDRRREVGTLRPIRDERTAQRGVAALEGLSHGGVIAMITESNVIAQLIEERPLLHPGQASWAVSDKVLHYFARVVKPTDRTIETGAGYSTIVLASLAAEHVAITNDLESANLTRAYLRRLGLDEKVTMLTEPSEIALPKLPETERFDFAFVDGCHAYPLPAIDWHFLDLHLKVGGLIGFDNAEIPSVHQHVEFLRRNGTYRHTHRIVHPPINYAVEFFEKLRDEQRAGIHQKFNHRRVTRHDFRDSLKTTIQGFTGRKGSPWPWS
jgi:predicted O-methyltransferase YrrM